MLGFLRETSETAKKAGIDPQTGLNRSGLNEYLEFIFPEVKWIHDKPLGKINGNTYRIRPDYRSDELMMIVEFDGLPHYQNPKQILKDKQNTEIYESLGYKVVRIPYFIQLTKTAVKTLFDVDIEEDLFPDNIPSLGNNDGDPACLCPAGISRMAEEFHRFPNQYKVNITSLKKYDDFLSGASLLEYGYNQIR